MKNFIKNVLTVAVGLWVAIALFAILVPVFIYAMSRVAHGSADPILAKSILHLKIRGAVSEHAKSLDFKFLAGSPFSADERPLPLFETIQAIDYARTDKRIEGIYLEIRDFESGWASLTALHRAIRQFADSGKFVYAYADSYNQKGYYLATAAEKIFVAPPGEVEFQGLTVSSPFLKGLLAKLEIEPRVFRVGKFKAAVEPLLLDKMSDANREQNQALLDDIWAVSRREAARFSGTDPQVLDDLANNLSLRSAEDAKAKGLVTDLVYEDDVIDRLKKKTVGIDNDLNIVTPLRLYHEREEKVVPASQDKIAIIFADGEISSGTGGRDHIGSEGIVADLEEALADEDVKAIVLRINSPGGDALAADIIWREIQKVDDLTPVIVSMGDVAASGGYYMAAAGRYVLAEPTTITGSIGVFGVLPETDRFFKNKLGVSFDSVNTHKHSNIGDANHEMSSLEHDFIQSGVERVYNRFLGVVQSGREFDTKKEVEEIAEGRVWSGTRAKEIGLVDELGGLNLALEKAALIGEVEKGYALDVYPHGDDPFLQLFENVISEKVSTTLSKSEWFKSGLSLMKAASQAGAFNYKPGVYTRLPYDLQIN
jgi:protease-4